MEGDVEIKECENDVGEINLINYENILKHNRDNIYKYIHVGNVQIQITPLFDKGQDIDMYAFLCDIRQRNSGKSMVSGIKSNLSVGSIGLNCRPGYNV